MTATTLASSPDVASSGSLRAAKILSEPLSEGHIGCLLRELTASWQPASNVANRRREHRFPCDLTASLAAVDNRGRILAGPPLSVRIKDVSLHGVGIVHPDPMPHRLVLLAFTTAEQHPVRLLVRLKWCRFKRVDVYESGGQILRVLEADERPDALHTGQSVPHAAAQESPVWDPPADSDQIEGEKYYEPK